MPAGDGSEDKKYTVSIDNMTNCNYRSSLILRRKKFLIQIKDTRK
jgi:hypothetical protein